MKEREIVEERHLTDLETVFWLLGSDPRLRTSFAAVTLLDRPVDIDHLRQRMRAAAGRVRRLRQVVVQPLGPMSPPEWADDPDFDVCLQVHSIEQPGATEQDIADLAVALVDAPFAPDRPLWELVGIDGGASGRHGLVWKFHHAVADGVGAIRLSEQFVDLERKPAPASARELAPPEGTSRLRSLVGATTLMTGRAVKTVAGAVGGAGTLATRPDQWQGAADQVRSLLGQSAFAALPAADDLWTPRSDERTLRLFETPFAPSKAAAKRHGGTLNHVFVAAVVQAAAGYHSALGSARREFRMAMPINTRRDGSAGGNHFSPVQFDVAATANADDQISLVSRSLTEARPDDAMSAIESITGLTSLVPGPVLRRVARFQTSSVDFTTSNVRGAPFDLYVGGALMESNHPVGPVAGTAFNITLMSYRDRLCMGIHADAAAITEPDLLAGLLSRSWAELTN